MKKIIICLTICSIAAVHSISTVIVNDTADPVVIHCKGLITYLPQAHECAINHKSEKIDFTLIHLCDNKPKEQLRVWQKAPLNQEGDSVLFEVSDILLREPENGLGEAITIEEIK